MSTETMTSRERILTAMRGGTPDTVPVQLGCMEMIPVRFSGRDFHDAFARGKLDLDAVRLEVIRHFGFDGYIYSGLKSAGPSPGERKEVRSQTLRDDSEYIVRRTTFTTPGGDLWEERTFPRDNSPTVTRGLIKSREDFQLYLEYFFPPMGPTSDERIRRAQELLGEDGVVGGTSGLPGLHHLTDLFDGRLEAATYFATDHPELIEAYRQKLHDSILALVARLLDARPDYIQVSASGMLTLSTPAWVRQLCLPTLKAITRLCRQAGVPCELHCCGKAAWVVQQCVEQTELDSINPLQPPPMGDCDLADLKRRFGGRICLKGNVGVTEPMLLGTPADVERDVLRCLDAAKAGGGYILFTEEQLGRDTPYENMHTMVRFAREHGTY